MAPADEKLGTVDLGLGEPSGGSTGPDSTTSATDADIKALMSRDDRVHRPRRGRPPATRRTLAPAYRPDQLAHLRNTPGTKVGGRRQPRCSRSTRSHPTASRCDLRPRAGRPPGSRSTQTTPSRRRTGVPRHRPQQRRRLHDGDLSDVVVETTDTDDEPHEDSRPVSVTADRADRRPARRATPPGRPARNTQTPAGPAGVWRWSTPTTAYHLLIRRNVKPTPPPPARRGRPLRTVLVSRGSPRSRSTSAAAARPSPRCSSIQSTPTSAAPRRKARPGARRRTRAWRSFLACRPARRGVDKCAEDRRRAPRLARPTSAHLTPAPSTAGPAGAATTSGQAPRGRGQDHPVDHRLPHHRQRRRTDARARDPGHEPGAGRCTSTSSGSNSAPETASRWTASSRTCFGRCHGPEDLYRALQRHRIAPAQIAARPRSPSGSGSG